MAILQTIMDCATVPAVSRWPVIVEAQVWSHASPRRICVGQSSIGTGFFPPVSIIPPTTHTHSFIYHLYYITLASNSNINNTPKKIKAIMNIGFRKPVPSVGKHILPNSKSIRALQAIMDKSQHITHKMNQSTKSMLIQVHKWKSLFIIYQQRIHKFLKLKIQIILYTLTSTSGSCMAISVSCPSV